MEESLKKALKVLNEGGIILYPTDTVWGLGCDATNKKAVDKIYKLKKRIETKSMIVLVDSDIKISRYVREVPELAYDLIEMSDAPLTIIYDNACFLAENLISNDGSVAIRVTKEEFSKKLTHLFKKPIVSSSANISGDETPQKFNDISKEIKEGVDYIVDYRQSETNNHKPSSIIKLGIDGEIKIIRK